MVLHLKNLELTQGNALCQVWLKLAQWFLRRRILNLIMSMYFRVRNYLLMEKVGALNLNKPESPLLKDTLCQVWLKLAH